MADVLKIRCGSFMGLHTRTPIFKHRLCFRRSIYSRYYFELNSYFIRYGKSTAYRDYRSGDGLMDKFRESYKRNLRTSY